MSDLFTNDIFIICINAFVLVLAIVILLLNKKDVFYKSALYIVAKVEEEWGSKMGKVKFAEAYEYIKHKYPIITFFLPEKLITKIIEQALVELKEILAIKAEKEEQEILDTYSKK